jgi:type IV pilus assembly protein PilB
MSGSRASSILEGVPSDGYPPHQDVRAAGHAQARGLRPPTRRGRSSHPITEAIIELEFVPRERVDAAVEEAKATGRRPEHLLLASGALTPDQLACATAERLGLDHVDLSLYEPDLAAANMLTPRAAKRYGAVPIGFSDTGQLLVAMSDPSNVLAIDDLKLVTGHEIRPVAASSDDIAGLIGRMSRLDEAVAAAVEDEDESGGPTEVIEIKESADDAPTIRLVNSIMAQAVGDGASDIHFEPDGRDMRVRFRVDGILAEKTTIPSRMVAGVVSRVKIMADLDISERRVPQDGRVGLKIEGRPVDVRIVTMPGVLGEGIVMRILQSDSIALTLDALGIRAEPRRRFEGATHQSYGAVLVTGPTGSGKSTTLYAALSAINSVEKNIITIEDPVEYQLAGINQMQVNARTGVTFATGLRSMLRADPDIIMVGEIRDSDTARIAIESALTGHLVLSTLHTNDAASAITRLTEMEVEPFLTASALDCVVAQRLARALCTNCKKLTVVSKDALSAVGYRTPIDIEAYDAVGCSRCNFTGYKGRVGLYEVMTLSDEIRRMTIERQSAGEIRHVAVEQGMRLLRDDGLDKVRLGVTSVAEITRVT